MDFSIYEDGIRQQADEFLPTQSPFNLLLLLDTSGSTGSYLKMMRRAAIEFTRKIGENDRVAVATFNSKVRLVQSLTGDRREAERALKRIKSGGGTAFYDALMVSIDRYLKPVQGRGAIVVFTDGIDNQLEGRPESGSRSGFDELLDRNKKADVLVYSIFLDTDGPSADAAGTPGPCGFPRLCSVYRQAKEQLALMADQTGGRMYSPRKIDELSGAYSEIADDLRVQYQLGYNSTNRACDGKWRSIQVELEGHPDAVIRTRRGYYARREATQ